jgi:replicative DNA helicase
VTNITEIPNNHKIEQLVLGACFLTVNAVNYLVPMLCVEDFYDLRHRSIFLALKDLYSRNAIIDLTIVSEHARERDSLANMGGVAYLVQVVQCVGTGIDFEFYLQELKNYTAKRSLINAAKNSLHEVHKPDVSAEDAIQNLQKELYEIQNLGNSDTQNPEEILKNYSEIGNFKQHIDWMQSRVIAGKTPYTGIASNYPILDETFGFFRNSCIYYIGARTSMGKTTFLLNLMSNMLSSAKPPKMGFFSLEMPSQLVVTKLMCIAADVEFSKFENGTLNPWEISRLMDKKDVLEKSEIFIEDEEDMTISKLRARARRMRDNYGIEVLFIDYLTRIKSNTKYSSKHLQVDEISKNLQSLAKELKIPIICLAQLNRQAAQRSDPTPSLADFRESGSIEEDCDGAILLHRPDYYDQYKEPGIVQVIVAKNRVRGILKNIKYHINRGDGERSERYIEMDARDQSVGRVVAEITRNQQECYAEDR